MQPTHAERRRFMAQLLRLAAASGAAGLGGAAAVAQAASATTAASPIVRPRRSPLRAEAERLRLHYPTPAVESAVLYQGLPIGNGRLGALVGGDPQRDFLYLTDVTMWEGTRNDALQADGQFPYDAQTFGSATMLAKLYIDLPAHERTQVSGYQRELDLSNGVVRVRYRHGGIEHRREAFASHPDRAIVVRLSQSGGAAGALTGRLSLQGTHGETTRGDGTHAIGRDAAAERLPADSACVAFEGRLANGRRHAAAMAVRHEGGTLTLRDGQLHFAGCRALTLVVCATTDYQPDAARDWRDTTADPLADVRQHAMRTLAVPARSLLHTHVADHRRWFDTMAVDLGPSTAAQRQQDSWSRLQARSANAALPDPELEALYLQFGRYLTIAGSRDSLPTPLQGLWLADNTPPWSGDYHSDVNLQMNYWLPDRAGLGALFEPLTAYCLAQVGSWTEITQRLFNDPRNGFRNSSGRIDGWTVAISTNPFGGNGWWWHPCGGAWLVNSLWQHVEYTANPADAQRILPLMRGALAFWRSRLITATVPDADGKPSEVLIADADWSPEHGPTDAKGITYAQELVWDLCHNLVAALDLTGARDAAASEIEAIQALQRRLYLPRVSPKRGALEEWMSPDDLGEPQHRHLSPLIGLFPGDRISADRSPKALLDGCAQLLRERGTESFGWACAWRALCWARLKDGETAYRQLMVNLRPSIQHGNGTAPNFFDVYSFGTESSAFQIDANYGTPTAMLEMLLYSRPGVIELLPALPRAWAARGRVTGLGARGGFVVDLAWAAGTVTALRVRSIGGRRTELRAAGRSQSIELAPGQAVDVALPLGSAPARGPSKPFPTF